MIEWCTKDMQVLEQWCTQNTFPRLRYIQEMFGKVEILNNEDLEPFYRRKKKTKLAVGGSIGRARG